jgi:hypothetical protein
MLRTSNEAMSITNSGQLQRLQEVEARNAELADEVLRFRMKETVCNEERKALTIKVIAYETLISASIETITPTQEWESVGNSPALEVIKVLRRHGLVTAASPPCLLLADQFLQVISDRLSRSIICRHIIIAFIFQHIFRPTVFGLEEGLSATVDRIEKRHLGGHFPCPPLLTVEQQPSIAYISAHTFRSSLLPEMLPFRSWRDKVVGDILEIWKTLFHHSDDSFVPAIQKIVDDAIELKTQIIEAKFVYRFVWADWGLCPTRFSNYLKIENAGRGGDISKVLLCLFPSFISLDLYSGGGRFQCLVKGVVMTENDRYSPDNISENPRV